MTFEVPASCSHSRLARERHALEGLAGPPAGPPAGSPVFGSCSRNPAGRPDQIVTLNGPPTHSGTDSCSGVLFGRGMKSKGHIANSCGIHLTALAERPTKVCFAFCRAATVISRGSSMCMAREIYRPGCMQSRNFHSYFFQATTQNCTSCLPPLVTTTVHQHSVSLIPHHHKYLKVSSVSPLTLSDYFD